MKKIFLVIIALLYLSNGFGQRIDTVYYDSNWKGVDNASFANFYKVQMFPKDPNYPKRFRDFWIDGTLKAEGFFISIDKYDGSKSVFEGKCISYFKNGKIELEYNYSNGKQNGEQKQYYEDGTVCAIAVYKDGVIDGLCKTYAENGNIIQDGVMHNDKFSGTYNIYQDEHIAQSCTLKDGILDGDCIYYENGCESTIVPYQNGVINGMVQKLNTAGVPIFICEYENNFKKGIYEYRTEGMIYKGVNKDMNPNQQLLKISGAAIAEAYPVKTKMNWLTMTRTGKEKYEYFICIDLNCYNSSEQKINCQIENIKVSYSNGGMPSQGIFLSEREAIEILQTTTSHTVSSAYRNAEYTANTAATRTSNSFSLNNSYNNTDIDIKNNTKSQSAAGAIGAAIGADNAGYVAGMVEAAVGASASKTESKTKGSIKQSNDSYSLTNSHTTDGYVAYQVYEKEKEAADQTAKASYEYANRIANLISCSQFSVNPNETLEKRIYVKKEKRFDSIRLNFTMNGIPYIAEWSVNEIDKRY
mgnify:CR=1 FL=1